MLIFRAQLIGRICICNNKIQQSLNIHVYDPKGSINCEMIDVRLYRQRIQSYFAFFINETDEMTEKTISIFFCI